MDDRQPTAVFNDGKTAKAQAVRLSWSENALTILDQDGGLVAKWPLPEIRAVPIPHGSGEVRVALGHGPGARLTVRDADDIAHLEAVCADLHARPGRESGWWKPYLGWGLAAVVSVVVIFTVIIPQLSAQLAKIVPWPWEVALTEQVEPQLLQVFGGKGKGYCDGPGLSVLRDRVEHLAAVTGFGHDINLSVVDSPIANAVALPGGRILVFRGLIDLADDPNAVVAVLAHELGHATYRHGMAGVIQSSATAALISLVLGDVTGGAAITYVAETLIDTSYSRDMERQADQFALDSMAEADWDAAPLAGLLTKLEEANGGAKDMDWMSSHPATEDRAQEIKNATHGTGRSMSEREWKEVRALCG